MNSTRFFQVNENQYWFSTNGVLLQRCPQGRVGLSCIANVNENFHCKIFSFPLEKWGNRKTIEVFLSADCFVYLTDMKNTYPNEHSRKEWKENKWYKWIYMGLPLSIIFLLLTNTFNESKILNLTNDDLLMIMVLFFFIIWDQ